MTVLIVEDNAAVRRLLRLAVSEIASEVRECGDGADALAAYEANRPDVVLMDIRMPHLDGLAATRQIRSFHPAARIVMVTNHDEDGFRSAAQEAGACAYVLKLDLLGLAEIVGQVTGSR